MDSHSLSYQPALSYQRAVLDNGLTVILHQDRKVPHVAVNVWYLVGSKNERPGKTGLAHLFEHLMFEGSLHHDGEYFAPLEDVGATQINGTTSRDRTNYFQTVPVHALDLALWLESDRMGYFLEAFTEEKLEEQRSVVLNEMRQGYNQPYGKLWKVIAESTYPIGHPYSWPVIGHEADVEGVTMDDARNWFQTYYGPTNAVLSLAGDIDFDDALKRVERYFGAIAPGEPIVAPGIWTAERSESRSMRMQERVPQAKLTCLWNIPAITDPEFSALSYCASVLASGRSSVLFRRLVHQDQLVTDIHASLRPGVIGSNFVVQADARPGVELDQVYRAIEEELLAAANNSLDADQLERTQTQVRSGMLSRMQRVGGLSGKANTLASGQAFFGQPDIVLEQMAQGMALTTEDLHQGMARWLVEQGSLRGVLRLDTVPFEATSASIETADNLEVDRSHHPQLAEPQPTVHPAIEQRTLDNGAQLLHIHRPDLPLVQIAITLPGGFASDLSSISGTASMTASALAEGTQNKDAFAISDQVRSLGARLSIGAHLDGTALSITALEDKLQPTLDLASELVAQATFPQEGVDRLREELRADIAQEQATPGHLAQRLLPKILFGSGHPYAIPFTGSGTEADLENITRQRLEEHRDQWYIGSQAKIAVAGSIDVEDISARLQAMLNSWPTGAVATPEVDALANPAPGITFVERPGSEQALIFGGILAPAIDPERTAPLEIFNSAFGGSFTSRINTNLREDKAWTYGAHSTIVQTRGLRPFLVYTEVDREHALDAILELKRELSEIRGPRPVDRHELERTRSNLLLSLPATWETLGAATHVLSDLLTYDLPVSTLDHYVESLRRTTLADVAQAIESWTDPRQMVWVVVGDAGVGEMLESKFEVTRLDVDGEAV